MTSCPLVFTATGQLIPTSKLYNAFRKPTKQAFLSLLSSSPSFVGNYYSLIVIYTKHSSVCVCVTGRKEKTSSSDHIKCMCQLLGYSPPPKLKQLLSCSKSWYFSGWFGVCFGLFFFFKFQSCSVQTKYPPKLSFRSDHYHGGKYAVAYSSANFQLCPQPQFCEYIGQNWHQFYVLKVNVVYFVMQQQLRRGIWPLHLFPNRCSITSKNNVTQSLCSTQKKTQLH